jgi:hypothetical protein
LFFFFFETAFALSNPVHEAPPLPEGSKQPPAEDRIVPGRGRVLDMRYDARIPHGMFCFLSIGFDGTWRHDWFFMSLICLILRLQTHGHH